MGKMGSDREQKVLLQQNNCRNVTFMVTHCQRKVQLHPNEMLQRDQLGQSDHQNQQTGESVDTEKRNEQRRFLRSMPVIIHLPV